MATKRGEVDLAPVFLWGLVGVTGLGIFASLELYRRLRAAKQSEETPPEPPPDGGEKPTS